MIRLQNTAQGMILHYLVYKRLIAFCTQYCPEQPAEPIVKGWLGRIYSNDDSLHILLDLDGSNLSGHAVIEVQRAYNGKIVIIHQCEHDEPSLERLDAGLDYVKQLASTVSACSIISFTTEHSKAYQKRYGFEVARTMMVKKC